MSTGNKVNKTQNMNGLTHMTVNFPDVIMWVNLTTVKWSLIR
jgi:hypothetical protein